MIDFEHPTLQGALLIDIIPRALPWARSFCPFRACCLYGLLDLLGVCLYGVWGPSGRAAVGCLTFRACCCGLLDLLGVAAYMGFCPLPLLYPSASDFQFRYAPVTVVSGRDALTSPKLFRPV